MDNKAEEKQLSEKSLQPSSPHSPPDHLKCNIFKAQMEAVFRDAPLTPRGKTCSQEINDRPVVAVIHYSSQCVCVCLMVDDNAMCVSGIRAPVRTLETLPLPV